MPEISVDLEKCSGNKQCKLVCPMDVFDLVEISDYDNEIKAVPVRMEDCIMCMTCVDSCPEYAITVKS
jgi:formate hydrogenlyase subunit 6/NADH:ubiquinone oxidoreductase subunit I